MERRIVVRKFEATGFDGRRPFELTVPVDAVLDITLLPAEAGSPLGDQLAVFEHDGKTCVSSLKVFEECTAPAMPEA